MMTVEADWSTYVMIGSPVVQTATPALFNAYCHENSIRATMVALDIFDDHDLNKLLELWRSSGCLAGLVSTIPHKSALAQLTDRLTPRAQRLQLVNCVRLLDDGTFQADMFDGVGFLAAAQAKGFRPKGSRCLIVGAGAAGSSIGDALIDAGAGAISVIESSSTAFAHFHDKVVADRLPCDLVSRDRPVDGYDLVVNASPVGMAASDPLPIEPAGLTPDTIVADCVTNREITPLLAAARGRGCRIQTGQDMALGQLPKILSFFGLRVLT